MIHMLYRAAVGVILLVFMSISPVVAQDADRLRGTASRFGFVENKGQVKNEHEQPNDEVLYQLALPGNNVSLRANGFSYDTYTVSSPDPAGGNAPHDSKFPRRIQRRQYKFHRVDVTFDGASQSDIVAGDAAGDAISYSSGDGQSILARHYGKVTYKNIYPGIDVEFVAWSGQDEKPLEYNFIVHPGADVDDIRLRYSGALGHQLNGTDLSLILAHGTLTERIPASYWEESRHKVDIRYEHISTTANAVVVGFSMPTMRDGETLVIDPEPHLAWATYYGGSGMESGGAVTRDDFGNIFLAGGTSSVSMVATAGQNRQANYGGGASDALLVKFNSVGVRQWAAYRGGAGEDYFVDVSVARQEGDVYVLGSTTSNSGIAYGAVTEAGPVHIGPVRGSRDAFVMSYSNEGTPQWGFYYGGEGEDEAAGMVTDGTNYFYITGYTNSTEPYQTQLQPNAAGGYDAFIGRFGTGGNYLYGTYFGGPGDDYGVDMALDHTGSMWLVGNTRSTSGIATTGAYKTQLSGTQDIFIRKISINLHDVAGNTFGTYYGGSGFDNASAMAISNHISEDIYICGTTQSSDGIATTGATQVSKGEGEDGFIFKMSPAGNPVWGTYYGSSGTDNCLALAVGYLGNVYVAGYTSSPDYFATPTAYQKDATSTYEQGNAFIARFSPEGARIWGSFYGGADTDVAVGIVSQDNIDAIFIGGVTGSSQGIAKGNTQQTAYAGGGDLFLAKFQQSDPCDQLFPDPLLTISATEAFEGQELVFTAAAHRSDYRYEYHFYYNGPNGRKDIQHNNTSGSFRYPYTEQGEGYPATGRQDILVVMYGGPAQSGCVKTVNFRVLIKPVVPLCETTYLVTTSSSVKLDKFSGSYVMQLNQSCAEDIALGCVYGKVDFPQSQNVVAASAMTYSDAWSYDHLAKRPRSGNVYEKGERGKWRPQATYVFNGGKVKVDKNFNSGTYVLPNFVWQRPDATPKAGWLKTTEVTRYTPQGVAVEERNALGIASTVKYGYNDALPYIVAHNADYNAVFFESFENTYQSGTELEDGTPSAGGTLIKGLSHSGSYSLQLESRFSTRPIRYTAALIQKGLVARVWVKGNAPQASMKLIIHAATSDQVVWQDFMTLVARTGEWSLWQGKISPNSFSLPEDVNTFRVALQKTGVDLLWIDDLRIQPLDAEVMCYVYDPGSLRLLATLDDQHFGQFYQYNMEGKLVRKMIETERGTKTVQEQQHNTPARARTTAQ